METAKSDTLSALPAEILYEVFSHSPLYGDALNLLCTCKRFYNLFLVELYKKSGRKANWAPMFAGAMSGDMHILERCLEAGARLDYRWPGHDPKWWVLNLDQGDQPILVAAMHYQVEAVEWMLAQGVNPYELDKNGRIRTLELMCESSFLKGYYAGKCRAAAGWRGKRVVLPNKEVLALRGRKIFDSVIKAGTLHSSGLTGALEWNCEPVEAKPAEEKERMHKDLLSRLPRQILVKLLSHLSPVDGGFRLVSASRFLYHTLILDLYREAGRQLSWLPLFLGAMDGNFCTLQTCLEAGAPIDHMWQGNQLTARWPFDTGIRPLHVAIHSAQLGSVRWLLGHGADPSRVRVERLVRYYGRLEVRIGFGEVRPPYQGTKQVRRRRQRDFMVRSWRTFQDTIETLLQAGAVNESPRRVPGRGSCDNF